VGDGLAGVDDGAAADREDQLRPHGERLAHALAREGEARIRLHAAERLAEDAGLLQLPADRVDEAAPLRAAAAVDQQPARRAVSGDQLGRFSDAARAEHDLGWNIVLKTVHVSSLPRDDFRAHDAPDAGNELGELLDGAAESARFGRDRHHRASARGDALIDRQYIRAAVGKNRQYGGQDAGLVLEHHLEGDDASGHEVLERGDRVAVLVKGAAADAHGLGGDVDLVRLAGLEHLLGFRDLAADLRQGFGFHDIEFRCLFHDVSLTVSRMCLCQKIICPYTVVYYTTPRLKKQGQFSRCILSGPPPRTRAVPAGPLSGEIHLKGVPP